MLKDMLYDGLRGVIVLVLTLALIHLIAVSPVIFGVVVGGTMLGVMGSAFISVARKK